MHQRIFGQLGDLSALTLGGGGIGQVWGPTTRDEALATVRAAWEAGITWFDVAPSYGPGEAEVVLGEAFGGRLPPGVRVSTKCAVGNRAAREVLPLLERSLDESLARLQLDRVDLFFVHNQIVPDASANQIPGTPHRLFVEAVRPVLEQLVARGRIGAWGITGIGVPTTIIATLNEDPAPAAVQVVANLLDSPGAMQRYDELPRPREIIAAASRRGIGVMGIRAVQAGALTEAFDREVPEDHPDKLDYQRSAPFRALARERSDAPASLAHRYALSMTGVATVVLGVKNRTELRECMTAEDRGVLDPALMARIDAAVGRA